VSPSVGYKLYTRGDEANLPINDNDLTAYSAQEVINVADSDDVWVTQTATGEYAIHQYKEFAPLTGQNECYVQWEGQSNAFTSPVFLQIYNQTTSTWETLRQMPIDYDAVRDYDSEFSYYDAPPVDTDFRITANVPDLTNYRSTQNIVSFRIYQFDG